MGVGKIVTISNKFTNKCHKVLVTISDEDCSHIPDLYNANLGLRVTHI